MVELRLAGLDCRLCGGTDGNGAGSGPLVVLLHGFGAPGTDLVDLAEVIRAPLGTRYLFPAGPIDLSVDGSYPGDARAWWPIDLVAVQVANLMGTFETLGSSLAQGIDGALETLGQLISAVRQELEPNPDNVILGGFSQGAILCLEAVMNGRVACGALVLLSPTLLDGDTMRTRATRVAHVSTVVSHGVEDPILPFPLSEELQRILVSAGWQVDWAPFNGGHGIGPEAIASVERLLFNQVGAQASSDSRSGA